MLKSLRNWQHQPPVFDFEATRNDYLQFVRPKHEQVRKRLKRQAKPKAIRQRQEYEGKRNASMGT